MRIDLILIIYILLAVIFLGFYIATLKKLAGSKSPNARKQRLITNLALFIYVVGFLTPVSTETVIGLAYILLVIVHIMRKREKV